MRKSRHQLGVEGFIRKELPSQRELPVFGFHLQAFAQLETAREFLEFAIVILGSQEPGHVGENLGQSRSVAGASGRIHRVQHVVDDRAQLLGGGAIGLAQPAAQLLGNCLSRVPVDAQVGEGAVKEQIARGAQDTAS